jgi:hypothetical protein
MDKILHFIEELYVARVAHRETEVISFNDFFGPGDGHDLSIPTGERSLAEAEGMGAWEDRHEVPVPTGRAKKALTLDQRRAAARALRKPREWEKP